MEVTAIKSCFSRPEPALGNEQWNPHFHDNNAVKLSAATVLRALNNKKQCKVLDCRAVSRASTKEEEAKPSTEISLAQVELPKEEPGGFQWNHCLKIELQELLLQQAALAHAADSISPSLHTLTDPSPQFILSHHQEPKDSNSICVPGHPSAEPSAHCAFLTAIQGTQTKLCMKPGINSISPPLQWLSCGAFPSPLPARPGHRTVSLSLTFPCSPLGKPVYLNRNVIYFWSPRP